jgi:hypothetical protein
LLALQLKTHYENEKQLRMLSGSKRIPKVRFSLPFIGHLLQLSNKPYVKLFAWSNANRYGPVYEIRLGKERAVVLNSVNVVREAFAKYLELEPEAKNAAEIKKKLGS